MPTGTATLDFGAFPGKPEASVSVTGQLLINGTSYVEAWIFPADTPDHSVDEHLVEEYLTVIAGNITPGTGFTIYGFSRPRQPDPSGISNLWGRWNIAWVWA